MAAKKTPLQQLEAKRERILEQIDKDSARASRVINGLGFGYAMRAYSRIKNMSTRVRDGLNERLDTVEKAMGLLGWRDPKKPVEPERTPEETLRHYCDVMDLDYEDELAKRNARKSVQMAH